MGTGPSSPCMRRRTVRVRRKSVFVCINLLRSVLVCVYWIVVSVCLGSCAYSYVQWLRQQKVGTGSRLEELKKYVLARDQAKVAHAALSSGKCDVYILTVPLWKCFRVHHRCVFVCVFCEQALQLWALSSPPMLTCCPLPWRWTLTVPKVITHYYAYPSMQGVCMCDTFEMTTLLSCTLRLIQGHPTSSGPHPSSLLRRC